MTTPNPLSLRVSLRRIRLALLVALLVGIVLTLTLFFLNGFTIMTFDKVSMTSDDIENKLNTYNSYSGSVASAVQRPIEFLLGFAIQAFVLRFLAARLLQPERSLQVTLAALAFSALVGFLLNNSLAALNVQLRDLPVKPAVLPSDLAANSSNFQPGATVTNVSVSVSENSVQNPITNTVLRSLLLPREPPAPTGCAARGMPGLQYARDNVDFGIFQRSWMREMLPYALGVSNVTLLINATDKSANRQVRPQDFPMNASLAADLLLTSSFLSLQYLGWGKYSTWREKKPLTKPQPGAITAGLLPPDPQASENQQREWFIEKSTTYYNERQDMYTGNFTTTNIPMTFSHVDILPDIEFDSLTMEIEVDPRDLAEVTSLDGKTRYRSEECNAYPFPKNCFVHKDRPDPAMQIHAYAWCAGPDGSERLWSTAGNSLSDFNIDCNVSSSSSILLVGVGKRLVADAIENNATVNASGITSNAAIPGLAVITNLRKIYSFTVGRLSWKARNIAKAHEAECKAPSYCKGLEFQLVDARKRLVIGSDAMPLKRLNLVDFQGFEAYEPLPFQIVRVNEPAIGGAMDNYGGLLLPHNIKEIKWSYKARGCSGRNRVDRLQLVLNNHMYMEYSLQATYTAGLFFLFHDGVVRDVIPGTLAFDGNVHLAELWLSVPLKSAFFTFAGCVLLVVSLVAASVWTRIGSRDDPLREIKEPQLIARVLVDENTFPPQILNRSVIQGSDKGDVAEGFVIESLQLKKRGDKEKELVTVNAA